MRNNISKSLLRKKFFEIESPKKPKWIKVPLVADKIKETKGLLKKNRVITVCEEANCSTSSI